jgi:3-polyprenyl-4-hydroxybenzoate decarboxylase
VGVLALPDISVLPDGKIMVPCSLHELADVLRGIELIRCRYE